MNSASFSPSVRPYLSVEDGEHIVEPVRGITFAPTTSRSALAEHLTDLASFGICELMLQQDDGMTFFTVTTDDESSILVFDDDSDSLVAVIPVSDEHPRDWN